MITINPLAKSTAYFGIPISKQK